MVYRRNSESPIGIPVRERFVFSIPHQKTSIETLRFDNNSHIVLNQALFPSYENKEKLHKKK